MFDADTFGRKLTVRIVPTERLSRFEWAEYVRAYWIALECDTCMRALQCSFLFVIYNWLR